MLNKISEHIDKDKKLDADGLPMINKDNIDDYIQYYENLIHKRTKVNVGKVREQAMKNISKKYSEDARSQKSKNLKKRLEEIRAFYEGDIMKMDRVQKDSVESKRKMKWYEWDMVIVLKNPDYFASKCNGKAEYMENSNEAIERYRE
jgi:hypothetical protein